MDTGTLIVGTILTACCFVPFSYLIYLGKSNSRKLSLAFEQEARNAGLHISIRDGWKDKFIGLDKEKNTLLFVSLKDGKRNTYMLNLTDYSSCRSSESFRLLESAKVSIIDRISLHFVHRNQSNLNVSLTIYDMDDDLDLEREQSLMRRWVPIIHACLPPVPQTSRKRAA